MLKKFRLTAIGYLNGASFLGVLNDNIYKLLIVFFLLDIYGIENSPLILASAGATYVLPFILFSLPAGHFADIWSKKKIIGVLKASEVAILALALIAFFFESVIGAYTTLFLLATHSALFGPSKYGIIPELVSPEKIGKANGLITGFTYIAIVIGTFLASFVLQISERNFALSALMCLAIAVAGFLFSLKIKTTAAARSKESFDPLLYREFLHTLKEAQPTAGLSLAIWGDAFFLFIGAFTQLNVITFAVHSLNLTDIQGGYLFLLTALGIGIGSALSGRILNFMHEFPLALVGGLGIVLSFFALYLLQSHLISVMVVMPILGLFGGFYVLSLEVFIQKMSPPNNRGKNIATANFLSFVGALFASLLIYIFSGLLDLTAAQGFLCVACLTLLVTLLIATFSAHFWWPALARLVCHFIYQISVENVSLLHALPGAHYYVCLQPSLRNLFIFMATQKQPLRLCLLSKKAALWPKFLLRFINCMALPPEQLSSSSELLKAQTSKGISLVFVTQKMWPLKKPLIYISVGQPVSVDGKQKVRISLTSTP